ncbi:hypothetical protein L1887_20247 [Cichorium endivia]|nr:hypothetical protein L1887_20247 [Cichorium endivia]
MAMPTLHCQLPSLAINKQHTDKMKKESDTLIQGFVFVYRMENGERTYFEFNSKNYTPGVAIRMFSDLSPSMEREPWRINLKTNFNSITPIKYSRSRYLTPFTVPPCVYFIHRQTPYTSGELKNISYQNDLPIQI